MNDRFIGVTLALADVVLGSLEELPIRFAAGSDAVQTFEIKASALVAQAAIFKPDPISVVKNARATHRLDEPFSVTEIQWKNLNSTKQR